MKLLRSTLFFCATSAFAIAAPQVIELTNGTKIVGTIEKQEAGKVYVKADLLGELVFDASALVPAVTAAVPPTEVKKATPPVAPVPVETATPTKDPNKVVWKRSLSVNGSYTSASYVQGPIPGAPAAFPYTGAQTGLQGKQSMVQFNGMLLRASATEAFTLTGSYGYAKYEPAGAVMNNWSAEATYTHMLSAKNYVLTRSTYKVDKISLVDHSFEQVVGYGFKLIDDAQDKLDVIPGVSAVNETKGTRFDNDWILSVGFLENYEHAFNERVSLEQRFKYRIGVKDTDVWAINSYLGLKAAITEQMSFNVGATYTYDNILGPLPATLTATYLGLGLSPAQIAALRPAKKDQLLITSGIEFAW